MDYGHIKNALETARGIISAHGIINYMSDHSKNILAMPVSEGVTSLRFEFSLQPTQPSWAPSNSSCSLVIDYNGGKYYEVNGDTHRDFASKIRVTHSSGEITLAMLKARENMMSTVMLLLEMIDAVLPSKITVVTETAAQKAEAAHRELFRKIGGQIGTVLGHAALKGIRSGGKRRVKELSPDYIEKYGEMPADGAYPYRQVRRWNRRGDPTEAVQYTFFVRNTENNRTIVQIERVRV